MTEKINLTQDGSSLSHQGQGTSFFKRGLTRADLQTDGKTPDTKELLNTAVMQGNKESRHSSNRGVVNASSSHVFKGELSMVRLTKSSVTGLK